MNTIKLGSKGEDVKTLQRLLGLKVDGEFGTVTEKAVKEFQKKNLIGPDGIVGDKTWNALIQKAKNESNAQTTTSKKLVEADYQRCAKILNVPVAAIKAVKTVESGSGGGFLDNGKPNILFEGHIFWQQLKNAGYSPTRLRNGNEDIIYPSWTKKYYIGGIREYNRLTKALKINKTCAYASTSYGLFQIMGFNYKACKCTSPEDMFNKMSISEGMQLELFCNFIKSNGWDKYLRSLDWAGFARKYNGPAYAQNNYDTKLKNAYLKYKTL